MRKLLILRPQPAADATADRARSLGIEPIVCPLFATEPVAWTVPDPADFAAVLLTSVNAVRHGGEQLKDLLGLPAIAVGQATADAARQAGFNVAQVGTGGVSSLLSAMPATGKLLHLCGESFTAVDGNHTIDRLAVYRAVTIADLEMPDLADLVVAVHSPRAGARLSELAGERGSTAIAAISKAAADACGPGWQSAEWPDAPTDSALLAVAARLCQAPPP